MRPLCELACYFVSGEKMKYLKLKAMLGALSLIAATMTTSAASASTFLVSDLNTNGNVGISVREPSRSDDGPLDIFNNVANTRFSVSSGSLTVDGDSLRTSGIVEIASGGFAFDLAYQAVTGTNAMQTFRPTSAVLTGFGAYDGITLDATQRGRDAELTATSFESWFFYQVPGSDFQFIGDVHFAVSEVPVPAGLPLLLSALGLGYMVKRRKTTA